MLEVTWSEQQGSGDGPQQGIVLEQPAARLDYYRDIVVLAFPTPASEQKGGKGVRLEISPVVQPGALR